MIIGNEGQEFVVTDGREVYKTGAQIVTTKVTTTVGEAATTEIRNLTFNDEDAVQPLLELQQKYPNADVFVSGNLTVDFPEDIQVPFTNKTCIATCLNNAALELSYCLIDKAIALLREQYVVGTVEVRLM